jgi:hypothetical protein
MAVNDHIEEYQGKPVQDYDPTTGITDSTVVYRVGQADYGDPEINEFLQPFLNDPRVGEIEALVIGCWSHEGDDNRAVVQALIDNASRLPKLRALFLGDIIYEEQEISWIVQSDLSGLFSAFTNLEEMRIRGGSGLRLGTLNHPRLKRLIVETGGLSRTIVQEICQARLPELEQLTLWLGDDYYGGDTTLDDLQPILSGTLFPKLTNLGLCNCTFADNLAQAIVSAPVLRQLEVLDLSLGNMSNEGARALLALPTDARLRKLDLHHHYMDEELTDLLQELPFEVDVSEREGSSDDEPEERYIAHSE